jgi:soluble lytic murein transglycosylase-like protein
MHRLLTVIFLSVMSVMLVPARASAGPVYVYRDGNAVRFSSKPPPAGVKAEIFTAKSAGFSIYRTTADNRFDPSHSEAYDYIIQQASKEHAIDKNLVKAVIHAESAFNPHAVSNKGALGLMQLMPERARMLGVRTPFEPEANIRGGVRHLAFLVRKYNGNLKLALAAYNAGEQAVEQYGGVPPFPETQQYVQRVLELKSRYTRLASRAEGKSSRG